MAKGSYRSPLELWRAEFSKYKTTIIWLILAVVFADVMIVLGMQGRIDAVTIFFAIACIIAPIAMMVVLISEIKKKQLL